MKNIVLLFSLLLTLITFSCMQDMPSEPPVGELKITSPSASDRFAIGDTVTIQAEAIMSKFSKMDFFVDGVLKGSDNDAPFTCEWLTAGAAVGLHEIKTVSYGAKGEISQSVKVELINGIAPELNIYEPVDNSSYKIGSVINVLATATDSDGSVKSVAFYLNDSLLKYETAEPYNASWNTTGYAEGSYTLKAVAKDNMGVVSSKQITINLYLKIPACVIETPANNSVYQPGQTVKIRAKATENLRNITSVKFYLDNNLVHTATTADSGSYYFYDWNTANVTTKNHQLKVTATDHNGRISTSFPVQVVINQVPTVDFISPQHNQMFSLGNTVQVSVNAQDTDGTIDNVKIFVDGVEKGFTTAPPYVYNWNTGGLAYGNHTLKAMATDDNGSVAEKEITVKLDQPALVNITSPAVASTHLAGSNITIAAITYDPDKKKSGKARSVTGVKFYVDNVLIVEDNSAPYQTVWNSTGATAGEHFVKAEVTDNYGTVSDQGIMFKLHTAPTVMITAPANNAPITIGTIVEIKASAADSKKGKSKAVSKVEFFVDGVLKGTDNSEPYSYNWNTAGTTVGTHAIKTVVTDDFNVTAENQITVNLNSAPEVSITAPANVSAHLIGSTILIKASATDSGKKLFSFKNSAPSRLPFKNRTVANVKFYINNVLKSTDDTAPYEYSWISSGLSAGSYTLKAVVTDDLGACAEEVISVVLHTAPTVQITAPANNAVVTIGSTVNVTTTTADSKSKAVSRIDFYIDGELKGTDNASPFAYSWNTAGLSIGVHTVKAVVTDNNGVSGEEQISVNLNAAPTVQITAPANNSSFTVGSVVDIAASAIDDGKKITKIKGGFFNKLAASLKSVSKVEFYIDDVLQSTDETAPYDFAWNTAGVAVGSHEIKAKAVDGDGAFAVDSVNIGLIVGWPKTFNGAANGDDEASRIIKTSDGGFLIAATTFNGNDKDYWIIKTDSNGNKVWDKTFNSVNNSDDVVSAIIKNADGDFILAGNTNSNSSWIIKIDSSGSKVWEQVISNCRILSITQTNDAGYIVSGSTGWDFWVAKLTSTGSATWSKTYLTTGISSSCYGASVIQSSDGNYVIAGLQKYYSFYMLIIKVDVNGELLWQKVYDYNNSFDGAGEIIQMSDNGFAVVGTTNYNGWLLKLDSSGDKIWERIYNGIANGSDQLSNITLTSDGSFILSGGTYNGSNMDIWLIKVDQNGGKIWEKQFSGTGNGNDGAGSVIQNSDGTYSVVGTVKSESNTDVWLNKLDANGEQGKKIRIKK